MSTFDSTQVTSLARIFGVSSDLMSARLTYVASLITDADKTAVVADIATIEAIEDDNVYVTGGPAGFTGSISPSEKRGLIKKRIAGLIQCPDLNTSSRLVRC